MDSNYNEKEQFPIICPETFDTFQRAIRRGSEKPSDSRWNGKMSQKQTNK